ncbi:MAG: LacI family DNA-binding transcriptional regulator [Thermotogota bacterium]
MDNPTIRDVAQAAGVSINTVSRALNNKPDVNPETRQLVLEEARKLRYKPNRLARGLRSNKTGVIGVIVADIANPFFSAVVKGMGEAAKTLGYSIILQDTGENYANEEEAVRVMQAEQVDGVLISPVQTGKKSITLLQEAGIPFVLVARYFADCETDYVAADDVQGGYLATKHLLDRRHERIALINGPAANSSAKERFRGYKMALEERGIDLDDSLIRAGALTMGDGRAYAKELLANEASRPTALFAFSDYVALGAMQTAGEAGLRVPRDIAIVGYDDIDFASCLQTPLTTVRVPKTQIGEEVVAVLAKKMRGEECHEQLKLPVELVVRRSS